MQSCAAARLDGSLLCHTAVDTLVRLLVVDLNAGRPTSMTDIADDDGLDIRTAVDASSAIRQCRLEYLDLVMINTGVDDASGVSLLETIRTLRPTVRAILINGTHVPLRQMVRELRSEPRHVPCFDEFQQIGPHAFALPENA